jgi:autotransporter-associated beta strand protein
MSGGKEMHLKPRVWFLISLLLFAAAICMWQYGEKYAAAHHPSTPRANALKAQQPPMIRTAATNALAKGKSYRISNTTQHLAQLLHNGHALILRNALIDTEVPVALKIPDHLRAKGAPGSYLVQADRPLDKNFYAEVSQAGASYIAYVPNNAALVQATPAQATNLAAHADVVAVLPYEPYYKLDGTLLPSAVEQQPQTNALSVTTFPGQRDAALAALTQLGARLIGEDRSPFGPTLVVSVPAQSLVAVAQLPLAQEIEVYTPRRVMNDLTRVLMGVAGNTLIGTTNYLNLSGKNVTVNINDTGVDATHLDFAPAASRLLGAPSSMTDPSGHGTHVAGVIAGSGKESKTVGYPIPGSVTNADFRGKASNATLFVQGLNLNFGPFVSDAFLQENASSNLGPTNLISNNSWDYLVPDNNSEGGSYDMHAASFDAATRDAQPNVDGEQPLLFVFAAGNNGTGSDNGIEGVPGSINSPATAKNVITVGTSDSPRFITNKVSYDGVTTNEVFYGATDNSDLVAGFSGCGNVDAGVEGIYGRFKPDVVAPGVFTISCRSSTYVDPTNETTVTDNSFPNQIVALNQTNYYFLAIPSDTSEVLIVISSNAASPVPFPTNMILLTNIFGQPPAVASSNNYYNLTNFSLGNFWQFGVATPSNSPGPVNYDLDLYLFETNYEGDYFTVLRSMNSVLGTNYLYASGTSESAAAVSGTLALMQEFLQTNMGIPSPSPALLKAMLINGSRTLGLQYDFNVNTSGANEQGWGLPNLPSCVPSSLTRANPSMVLFNQSASNALATGQYQTYTINCSDLNATNYPFRITLVWTDPPGDPAAGIALVNNLDLTAVDANNNIYIGNDFLSGDIFTEVSSSTNLPPGQSDNTIQNIYVDNGTASFTSAGDPVNNVQNVYIDPNNVSITFPLTVTISGTRVNVNAVTTQTNNILQDYALVIESDDPILGSPLAITPSLATNLTPVLVTIASNGVPLLHERVGANEPNLYNYPLGQTNGNLSQWHFFIFTNDQFSATNQATNVAFTTFMPPNLSIPRSTSADIDLYVSTNSGLLSLIPSVVQSADKSLGRTGTETIMYTNSFANEVYYIGVKSEDQQASDFGFFGVAQQAPFSTGSSDGNTLTATGTPLPVTIPNALSASPALVFAFIFNHNPLLQQIRRVTTTVGIQDGSASDLYGTIQHNGVTATLNHNTGSPGGYTNTYDDLHEDSNSGDVSSDGPGNLAQYVNQPAEGLWLLTEADNYVGGLIGTVTTYSVSVDLQQPQSGYFISIPGQSWFDDYLYVPNDATNLIIYALYEGGNGPIGIYLTNNVGVITTTDYGSNNIVPPGGSLTLGTNNPPPGWPLGTPPLAGGYWYYGIYNSDTAPVTLYIVVDIQESLTPNLVQTYTNNAPINLTTDGHTQSQICITNGQQVVALQVGVRIDDTNLDDLVLHLTSPEGTSVLLFEDRGGTNATNLGLSMLVSNGLSSNGMTSYSTNYVYTIFTEATNLTTTPIKFAPPPFAATLITPAMVLWSNSFETVTNGVYTNGSVLEGWLVTNNVVTVQTTNGLTLLTNDEVGIVADPNGELIGTNSLGTNYLALTSARIIQTFGVTNTFTITNGMPYQLVFYAKPMGVIDWWPADNNTDDIIGTNNGTIPYSDVTFDQGEVARAFTFSGISPQNNDTGNEVDFGTNAGNFGTNNFTIDFWIQQPSGTSGTMGVLEKRATCNANFSFLDIRLGYNIIDPSATQGLLFMDLSGDNIQNYGNVNANEQINDGAFHHAAFVRNGLTLAIYIDGILNTNVTTSGIANLTNSDMFRAGQSICVGTDGSVPFVGELDELDLINRALSPAEVYAIYHAGSLGKYNTNSLLPNFQLTIDGVTTNTVILTNASEGWQLITNSFIATNNQVTVEFSGNTMGVLFDDIQLIQLAATNYNNYYLPEEPLTPFVGENPLGCWTLDVWDTRNDSSSLTNGTLWNWTMQVTTSSTNVTLIVLTNGEAVTVHSLANSITYFAVDVPPYATYATNLLTDLTGGPLTLFFDQSALPTGGLPGDVTLASGVSPGSISTNILATIGAPPPLLPGQRYFLGVLNNNVGNSKFTMEVDFNGVTNPIIPLTNAIPYTNVIGTNTIGTNGPEYYSFLVPTNAVMVTFQILNPTNGEVDLYASDSLPLPGPFDFDYKSCNAGSNDQFIVVTTNSVPVALATASTNDLLPLSPVTWYFAAYNAAGATNGYTIVATVVTNGEMTIIPLTNAVPYTNTAPPGYPTNLLYSFTITNNPAGVQFAVTNLTNGGNVQLLASLDVFPTPETSYAGSYNAGTNVQFIQIVPNANLASLNGVWYLAVPNTVATNVSYTITAATNSIAAPPIVPLTWSGAVNESWDILVTSNWVVTGSSPVMNYPYQDGSMVTFDDSATGTTTVNLTTTLSPASVTISNAAKTYTFIGSGAISGATGLVKTNSGPATFTETGGDDFSGGITMNGGQLTFAASNVDLSGGVTVNAGTLILDQSGPISGGTTIALGARMQVGNNDANGSLPSGGVTNGGALIFNQTNSSTVGNIISGNGKLSQIGTGILALAGINTYTGSTVINGGTLVVDNTNALGSWTGGAVTIANGGTLDLSGLTKATVAGNPLFGAKPFYLLSAGVGGNGAIVNNGIKPQQGGFEDILLNGDSTIGGSKRWDMRNPSGNNTLNLGGFTLTKTGVNQISLVSTIITSGNVVINQGILSIEATPIFSGTLGTITVNSNGLAGQNLDTQGSFTCPIVLNGGGTTNLSAGGITYLDAPILLTSNSSLGNGGGIEIFNGIISGAFGLTNLGPGSNLLAAVNTYSGVTVVAQGTLTLNNTGSISNSVNIIVATNATLDASQRIDQTLTLAGNQTLFANGTVLGSNLMANAGSAVFGDGLVAGNLTINPGATLSPGAAAGMIGTLTSGGTAFLGGTSYMKINKALAPSNDVLTASNVIYGGTLIVTNLGAANSLVAGDSFTLFNVSNSSGAFLTQNLPPLPSPLTWSTTFNSNGPGTLIVVTNTQPFISQFSLVPNPPGSNVVFIGTNGVPGGQYVLLTSTNVALPLTNWTPIATNFFDQFGDFNFTNAAVTNQAQFYILQSP